MFQELSLFLSKKTTQSQGPISFEAIEKGKKVFCSVLFHFKQKLNLRGTALSAKKSCSFFDRAVEPRPPASPGQMCFPFAGPQGTVQRESALGEGKRMGVPYSGNGRFAPPVALKVLLQPQRFP